MNRVHKNGWRHTNFHRLVLYDFYIFLNGLFDDLLKIRGEMLSCLLVKILRVDRSAVLDDDVGLFDLRKVSLKHLCGIVETDRGPYGRHPGFFLRRNLK